MAGIKTLKLSKERCDEDERAPWIYRKCDEAFAFYEKVFGTKRLMTMKYSDVPAGTPVPPDAKDLVMHTSLPVGSITLMGADAPPGRGKPMGGFEISMKIRTRRP